MGITGGLALFLLGPGDNVAVSDRDHLGGLELRRGSVPAAGDPGRRDRLRRAAHRQAPRGAVSRAVGAGAEVHRDPERVAAARAAGLARLPAQPAAVPRGAARDPRGLRAHAVGVLDRGVLHRLALPDRREGAPRDPRGRSRRTAAARRRSIRSRTSCSRRPPTATSTRAPAGSSTTSRSASWGACSRAARTARSSTCCAWPRSSLALTHRPRAVGDAASCRRRAGIRGRSR